MFVLFHGTDGEEFYINAGSIHSVSLNELGITEIDTAKWSFEVTETPGEVMAVLGVEVRVHDKDGGWLILPFGKKNKIGSN